jgi:hypothetical protein
MPSTYKSLAFVWLISFALFTLAGSGAVAGPWLLLLLAVGLAAPAVLLRDSAAATMSPRAPRVVTNEGDRSPLDLGGIDVCRWENEGGARRIAAAAAP